MCFANIFSEPVACLFIHRADILNFIKSSSSFFSFMDDTFDVVPKKSSFKPRSSRFYAMLSSRKFIVLHFTFMTMIHFELICVTHVVYVWVFFLSFFYFAYA